MPTQGTAGAAAYDLIVPNDVLVKSKSNNVDDMEHRKAVPLGISIELPKGYCALILPRSGNTIKGIKARFDLPGADKTHPLDIEVQIGLIDEDYRGVISAMVINRSPVDAIIPKGTKVAQILIQRVDEFEFTEVEELSTTERGDKGFGSTDRKEEVDETLQN